MQPFETRFISKHMSSLLNEVHKIDERSQHERKIVDNLNKIDNQRKKTDVDKARAGTASTNGSSTNRRNFDSIRTYDSKFSLKVFKLVMVDQA